MNKKKNNAAIVDVTGAPMKSIHKRKLNFEKKNNFSN